MMDVDEVFQAVALLIAFIALLVLLPFLGVRAVKRLMRDGPTKRALLADRTPPPSEPSPSSARSEWRRLFLYPAVMLVFIGMAFWNDSSADLRDASPAILTAYVVGVVWLIRALLAWLNASPVVMDPAEVETLRSQVASHWFSRYSMATVVICAAIVVLETKPQFWWMACIAVLWAAFLAAEISFVLLIAGGAYLAFLGLASVPVSVAIVIGACIIAAAIRR